ncbi:S8 family serine peptidase [Bacillus sp. 196mf]|uniref:S8 family peptidase n=1 Tax=Bacillus sp. 196mf TaxID=1761754 RepID=UPI000D7CBBA4|nr:S8 family serine peptidase [Bacillus sp. 196mf]PYE87146.1 subtilase family protein [Bacillus sp. 196mf]
MIKEGQLIITFHTHVDNRAKNQVHTQLGGKKIDEIPQFNIDVIIVPIGEERKYRKMYNECAEVKFVDFNAIRRGNKNKKSKLACHCIKKWPCYYNESINGCIPNDPYYFQKTETSQGLQNQWGLQGISPEQAFCRVKNMKAVVKIAIIDSGIDPNHPDLIEKIVDPINFSSNDPNDYIDGTGHGTFVSGIAAAVTDNKTGIASASYNTANIIPIRVVNSQGFTTTVAVVKGILYAIEKNAQVINMSFGGPVYIQAEQLAVERAWNQGIIIVASGGNNGSEQPNYPSDFNFVLGVSSIDKTNKLAYFSSWGVGVGITVPGTAILSTTPTYPVADFSKVNYDAGDGTSFSAPFVSGTAAMLRALKPQESNQKIIQVIQKSARRLMGESKGWNSFYGYGLLNLDEAVNRLLFSVGGDGEGSFYGQVVGIDGVPRRSLDVLAVNNQTKLISRKYQTKYPIEQEFNGQSFLGSDGMFRLFNLPVGNYSIYAGFVSPETRLAENIAIIPGADVYLKFILSANIEEYLLSNSLSDESCTRNHIESTL